MNKGCRLAVFGLLHALPLWASAQTFVRVPPGTGVSQLTADHVVHVDKVNHWNFHVGPGFTQGLEAGAPMVSVGVGYSWSMYPRVDAKVAADASLGSSGDTAQMVGVNFGPTYYLSHGRTGNGRAYTTADLGVAAARNNSGATNQGLTVGAGVGYELPSTTRLQMDAQLHAMVLTAPVAGANPSVIGARLGITL